MLVALETEAVVIPGFELVLCRLCRAAGFRRVEIQTGPSWRPQGNPSERAWNDVLVESWRCRRLGIAPAVTPITYRAMSRRSDKSMRQPQ
jgi:hypothetical protein